MLNFVVWIEQGGFLIAQAPPPKKKNVRLSVRVWTCFNFRAKADVPLEYGIRHITGISEEEFLEGVDEEFVPLACARFGEGQVTFVDDFESYSIPPSVYHWFPNFRIDHFPPNCDFLSPFSAIWSSLCTSLNCSSSPRF